MCEQRQPDDRKKLSVEIKRLDPNKSNFVLKLNPCSTRDLCDMVQFMSGELIKSGTISSENYAAAVKRGMMEANNPRKKGVLGKIPISKKKAIAVANGILQKIILVLLTMVATVNLVHHDVTTFLMILCLIVEGCLADWDIMK